MPVVSLALLLAALVWPAGLSSDDAARLARGDVVEQRSLASGIVRYTLAARIDAPVAATIAAARDVCANLQKGKDAPQVLLLLPAGVEAFLQKGGTDLADAALRTSPSTSCQRAAALPRYYVLADAAGKFPFPASSTLLRVDVAVDADGALAVKTLQVLGGAGGSHVDGSHSFVALDDGATASIERGVFRLPSMVPDFIARGLLDDEEGKRAWRLRIADLQRRAQLQAKTMTAAPPPATTAPTPAP